LLWSWVTKISLCVCGSGDLNLALDMLSKCTTTWAAPPSVQSILLIFTGHSLLWREFAYFFLRWPYFKKISV
jgi:hypothetical protein